MITGGRTMKGWLCRLGLAFVVAGMSLLVVAGPSSAVLEYWNGHKWPSPQSRNIKYRIYNSVPSHLRQSVVNAANTWSQPSSNYKLYRTQSTPSWGQGGTVSYHSFTEWWLGGKVNLGYEGTWLKYFYMHFNADWEWTQYCWFLDYVDFEAAAVHEFGHVTDFISVDDTNTVMYRHYRNCVRSLYSRDVNNLRALYGS
jgi:hypothetical protein